MGQRADMLDAVHLQSKYAAGRSLPGEVGNPAAVERAFAQSVAMFKRAHYAGNDAGVTGNSSHR